MSENDQLDDIMDKVREALDGFGEYRAIRYKHLVVVTHPDYPVVTLSMTEVVLSIEPATAPVVSMPKPPEPPIAPAMFDGGTDDDIPF